MQKFYKVLGPSGESISGGKMDWNLPTSEKSGDWMESHTLPDMCSAGLHLTTDPKVWIKSGSRIFEVEGRDFLTDDSGTILMQKDKAVCRFARLIRELSDEECKVYHLLKSGEHSVSEGAWIACGTATVRAYDSATVRAYDSATVRAYDSATVRASDSATVLASDSATVRAYDSATVEAYDSATVWAYDSATVWAYDSATVEAYGSATVEAYGSATVRASGSAIVTLPKFSKATVTLKDESVLIDRREDGYPKLSHAGNYVKEKEGN